MSSLSTVKFAVNADDQHMIKSILNTYNHKIVRVALCQFTLTVALPGRMLSRNILGHHKMFQTALK